MEEFSFQALGTQWSILIDGRALTEEEQSDLLCIVSSFEKQFSRFLPTSEVNQFRVAEAGVYPISSEFRELLAAADTLRKLTKGVYDPAVGALLESAGYDAEYRLIADEDKVEQYQLPVWSLEGAGVSLEGPTLFDLGGIGKGYCIDKVARFLRERGQAFFLVEAGGDMYATSKQDGRSFQIALEWPGKPGVAFGTVALHNAGLAASDSFRRRWKDWHHILDPQTKQPIQKIVGCTAVAKTAFQADCMTSGLFLASSERYQGIASELEGEFVVFAEDGKVQISTGWPGELFIDSQEDS